MTKVKLRRKAISQGRLTLYLDYYPPIPNPDTGKLTRREFLGLYIYENAIISSNTKPCQSPILDVKKQQNGTYIIVPVLRTKRSYSSGR